MAKAWYCASMLLILSLTNIPGFTSQSAIENGTTDITFTTTTVSAVETSTTSTQTQGLNFTHIFGNDTVAKSTQNLTYTLPATPRGAPCTGSYFLFAATSGQLIYGGFLSTAPLAFSLLSEIDYERVRGSIFACDLPASQPVTPYITTGLVRSYTFNWTVPYSGDYYFHLSSVQKLSSDATVTVFADTLTATSSKVIRYVTFMITSTIANGQSTIQSTSSATSTQSMERVPSSLAILVALAVAVSVACVAYFLSRNRRLKDS